MLLNTFVGTTVQVLEPSFREAPLFDARLPKEFTRNRVFIEIIWSSIGLPSSTTDCLDQRTSNKAGKVKMVDHGKVGCSLSHARRVDFDN